MKKKVLAFGAAALLATTASFVLNSNTPPTADTLQTNVLLKRTINLSERAQARALHQSQLAKATALRNRNTYLQLQNRAAQSSEQVPVPATKPGLSRNAIRVPEPGIAQEIAPIAEPLIEPIIEAEELADDFERLTWFADVPVPEDVITMLTTNAELGSYGAQSPEMLEQVRHAIDIPELRQQGIRALVGVGVSDFSGSTAGREHNIEQGLSRFDGVVIPQGSNFSFNQLLGPVNYNTGFGDAKIIRQGKAVTGIGGGVCQVSTTVFRAAYNAGLPITTRRNHTFPVTYYGPQQGLDATIYPGSQDLRFENNTPGDLLLITFTRGKKLITLLYGTPDRDVNVSYLGASGSWWSGLGTSWERDILYFDEPGIWHTDQVHSNYRPPA